MAVEVPNPRGSGERMRAHTTILYIWLEAKRCRQQFCRDKREEIRDLTKAEEQESAGLWM